MVKCEYWGYWMGIGYACCHKVNKSAENSACFACMMQTGKTERELEIHKLNPQSEYNVKVIVL